MVPTKKMILLERKIKKQCPECKGEECDSCKSKVARMKIYALAGIPMNYWMLSLKKFQGDQNFRKLLVNKIVNIDKMYDEGKSLAFVGSLGTGKTYGLCCLLKTALVSGYSAKYLNMSDIIEETTKNDPAFFEKIVNVDFLGIDEYGSRWVYPSEKAEQLFGQTMERIFRHRFQNGMPTIICSNTPDLKDVLADDFADSVDSLFSNFVKIIYIAGKDFRKVKK